MSTALLGLLGQYKSVVYMGLPPKNLGPSSISYGDSMGNTRTTKKTHEIIIIGAKLMKLISKKLCTTIIGSALICASVSTSVSLMASPKHDEIKVMSRNIYLGADIFPVLAAAQDPNPIAIPLAVTDVFQTVQQTNFPERAQALADEIERRKPDVIGLQEVSTWRTQIPGDFLIGNPTPASDIAYDFLDILLAALEERDLHYNVAVSVDNADLELPMIVGFETTGAPIFGDLRLSDRDVILVKDSNDISYSTTIANNFTVNGVTPVGGTNIEFTRGYTMADIQVRGTEYRFVNTHLETGGSEPFITLQAIQMNELLQVIDATTSPTTPVILLGDFNSGPTDVPFTSNNPGIPPLDGLPLVPPYLQAVGTGYTDLWLSKPKAKDGFTCCFDGNVSDADALLSERIDHIFINPKNRQIKKLKTKLVGQSNADMTDDSSLYPSDHAGIYGKIKLED